MTAHLPRALSQIRKLGQMTREEVDAVAHRRELGEIIDQLGVKQQIDPDQRVCGVVVLLTSRSRTATYLCAAPGRKG